MGDRLSGFETGRRAGDSARMLSRLRQLLKAYSAYAQNLAKRLTTAKAELMRTRDMLTGSEELQATIDNLESARRDGQSVCDQLTAIGEDLKARTAQTAIELTQRQWDVLQLISEGRSLKEIAYVLSISPKTVEFHKYAMMQKLGFRSTAELIKYYMHRRLAG